METQAGNKMGKWGATSYVIGNMLGSGIFITPTAILLNTKSVGLSLSVWAASALISALGAFCYVELGTSIRRSGNDFAYMCYVKWNAIGFIFMANACILTFPLTLAIQAEAFSEYIIKGLNVATNDWHEYAIKKLIGFALVWLLMFLNFFSLKKFVARFQMLASVAKLLSAAIVIITGFYYLFIKGKTENLRQPFANSNWNVGALVNAFFSGLFSYDGWDILNFGAEDIENPKSSMLFAVIFGITTVALLYISMNLSYFTILTISEVENTIAVATTFAQQSLGGFHYFMPLLVSVVIIGSLNSSLFAASRCMFAAAREGQLPSFIGCKNVLHDSPRAALFYHVVLAMIFSFIGNIDQLINSVAFGMWMQRCFTMCALLYIRLWHVPVHADAIRAPIFLTVLFLGVCLSLVIATMLQNLRTTIVGLSMLAICAGIYALFLRKRTSSSRFERLNYWLAVYTQIVFDGLIELDEISDDQQQQQQQEQQQQSELHLLRDAQPNASIAFSAQNTQLASADDESVVLRIRHKIAKK